MIIKSSNDVFSINKQEDSSCSASTTNSFVNSVLTVEESNSNTTNIDTSSLNVQYSANSDESLMDAINKSLTDHTPELAFKMIPENFVKMGDSSLYCDKNNIEAYNNLPRTSDGEFDIVKIKDSLQKASEIIKSQNNVALETLSYGIYKNAINSTDLLTAFLGPEVAHVLKNSGINLPEFLKEGVCIYQLLNYINEALDYTLFLDSDILTDLANVKPVEEIQKNIENQNLALDELLNFDINSDADAEEFLNAYLKITGTAFSCERIDEYYELKNDESVGNDEKLKSFASCCGTSDNLVDANKNKILTDIVYDVGLRYIVPTILNKVNHPVVKGIGLALPTYIQLVETITEGCTDGEMVNLDNLDYDKFINILSDGAVRAFIVALPFSSWGKEILSKCKPMKAIFKPEKNSVWNNLFVKMFGTRPAKTLGNVSAACVIAQMTKFMIPDVTSEDWYFRVLSPKYNAYKTIKEWIY